MEKCTCICAYQQTFTWASSRKENNSEIKLSHCPCYVYQTKNKENRKSIYLYPAINVFQYLCVSAFPFIYLLIDLSFSLLVSSSFVLSLNLLPLPLFLSVYLSPMSFSFSLLVSLISSWLVVSFYLPVTLMVCVSVSQTDQASFCVKSRNWMVLDCLNK